MGAREPAAEPSAPDAARFRAAVPARAVLTELARGFLLVHESNPDRAVRFAERFLRECTTEPRSDPVDASRPVTDAQRQLGRLPRGAVDPSNFPPPR